MNINRTFDKKQKLLLISILLILKKKEGGESFYRLHTILMLVGFNVNMLKDIIIELVSKDYLLELPKTPSNIYRLTQLGDFFLKSNSVNDPIYDSVKNELRNWQLLEKLIFSNTYPPPTSPRL